MGLQYMHHGVSNHGYNIYKTHGYCTYYLGYRTLDLGVLGLDAWILGLALTGW